MGLASICLPFLRLVLSISFAVIGARYFELVQNLNRDHWSLGEVNKRLGERMVNSFKEVHTVSEQMNASMRTAAYVLA
jgi:glutamate dehydrogenase/leucine dehydrogenase